MMSWLSNISIFYKRYINSESDVLKFEDIDMIMNANVHPFQSCDFLGSCHHLRDSYPFLCEDLPSRLLTDPINPHLKNVFRQASK